MTRKSFMQGALVLGIAGLIIKLLGAIFRIPLANIIGEEGMGYYQTAYPIYVLFLTLSTAGIPIAISKLVSERCSLEEYRAANKVFRVSFLLLSAIGIVSSISLFLGAEAIVGALGNPKALLAMKAIAPALLFVPIMAAFRGYFQGMQNMKPTAASQIIEQLFRVAAGLSLSILLVQSGRHYAAAGASFGATAGAIAGLAGIAIIYYTHRRALHHQMLRGRKGTDESTASILSRIFVIAVPVTIGAAIMPIMGTIDVAIVMKRLQATGYTEQAANSLYGQLTGMAGPLINFPQVLSMSIAMSLVPAIAGAYQRRDMEFLRHEVELGVRTSMLIGLPSALGLMVLAEPIMLLLYPMQKASAVSAASSLFLLAFGVIFLSVVQTLTGVLQGLGKQMIPVRNLMIGALAKVILTYTLTGIESINVRGAALGTVVAYMLAAFLNLLAVRQYTGVKFDWKLTVGKPVSSVLVMSGVVFVIYRLALPAAGNAIATLSAILAGGLIYFSMLFVTGCITEEELLLLPKGKKLAGLFHGKGKR